MTSDLLSTKTNQQNFLQPVYPRKDVAYFIRSSTEAEDHSVSIADADTFQLGNVFTKKKKNAETKFTDSFTCSKFTFLKVTFPGVAGPPGLELTQPRPCLATSGSNFLCISGTHVIGYSRLFQESNASVKVCGLVFHYSLVIALRFPTQFRQTFVFLTGL